MQYSTNTTNPAVSSGLRLQGKQNSHHQTHCSKEQRNKGQGQGNQKKLSPWSSGTKHCHGQKRSQQIRSTYDHHSDQYSQCLCPIDCFPRKGLCKQVFRSSFRTFSGVNGNAEVHSENAGGNHEKAGQKPINAQRGSQVFHRYADTPVKSVVPWFQRVPRRQHPGSCNKSVSSKRYTQPRQWPAQDIGSMPFQFIFQNDHT